MAALGEAGSGKWYFSCSFLSSIILEFRILKTCFIFKQKFLCSLKILVCFCFATLIPFLVCLFTVYKCRFIGSSYWQPCRKRRRWGWERRGERQESKRREPYLDSLTSHDVGSGPFLGSMFSVSQTTLCRLWWLPVVPGTKALFFSASPLYFSSLPPPDSPTLILVEGDADCCLFWGSLICASWEQRCSETWGGGSKQRTLVTVICMLGRNSAIIGERLQFS